MKLATAAGLAVVLLPATAGAVEREHALGVDVGPAIFVVNDKGSPDIGATFGLHYTYGLSDAFNLVADAEYSLVALNESGDSSTPKTRPTMLWGGAAGLAYVLDVLRWVPWGAAEIGVLALDGGTIPGTRPLPDAILSAGLDYRLSRSWAVGASFRQHFLFTDMGDYPSFTQVFARFEYVWGW
jgi:hypothetical protein